MLQFDPDEILQFYPGVDSGWYWSITAGKKLRSEYLAWASPYFAFFKSEQLSFYLFRCGKSYQNV